MFSIDRTRASRAGKRGAAARRHAAILAAKADAGLNWCMEHRRDDLCPRRLWCNEHQTCDLCPVDRS